MGLGMSTIKYILFIFNVLCALLGIAVIVAGGILLHLLLQVKDQLKEHESGIKGYSAPIAIIVLGSLIFMIAFFGCCGAIRESHCMTMTYSVFLFILMVLQIALVVFIFVLNSAAKDALDEVITTIFRDANQTHDRKTMSFFEEYFQCCGRRGPGDYVYDIPATCYPSGDRNRIAFTKGCSEAVTEEVKKHMQIVGYVGIAVFVVELIGFIFACCLATNIRNNKRRSTY